MKCEKCGAEAQDGNCGACGELCPKCSMPKSECKCSVEGSQETSTDAE